MSIQISKSEKVLAGFSPLFALILAVGGLIAVLTLPLHFAAAPYLLLLLCWVALLLSGVWLSRCFYLFHLSWPFIVCVVAMAGGWAWQRYVYLRYLPNKFLEYGYFLKPVGRHVRFLLIEAPVQAFVAMLAITLLAAAAAAWRNGARASLVLLAPWAFAAFVVFGMPAFGLSLQGDAAVFI